MRSALLVWLAVLATAGVAAAAASRIPSALRSLEEYRVTHVVVTGTTLLTPEDALDASGIGGGASVFDDFEVWRASLLEHPLVVDASVERELPARIHLKITETRPLALVRTPELRAVDARALLLPLRPGAADLDLPLLMTEPALRRIEGTGAAARRSFSRVDDAPTLALLHVLAVLADIDPEMFAAISEARPAPRGGAVLRMRAPRDIEILLPAEPDRGQLQRARLVLAHLAVTGELQPGVRLDARFRDQIVVAPKPYDRVAAGAAGTARR
jgi:hypothetical protein